jgi:molecular chaperone HtpG
MRPKVGAFVLETLTTGMYTDPLDSLREYVQNSSDSIRSAEKQGLLTQGEGRIVVHVEDGARRVTIRDNGLGVAKALIESTLLNVGISEKTLGVDAGFRGIGRLAGIAYCRRLAFRTSHAGESDCVTLSLDCDGIREAIRPGISEVRELTDVLACNSHVTSTKADLEDRFFEVVLDEVTEGASGFLDESRLEEYLGQVAPVEFDAQRFLYAPQITECARSQGLLVPTVTVLLTTPRVTRQVLKPYRTHYRTQRNNYEVHVKGVRFWPEPPAVDAPFWLWYGVSELAGMLDDRSAGIRFRKHNIQVGGPERVAELFAAGGRSNARFNAYYIGEIHVTDPRVIPNARRDGFEDCDTWLRAKTELSAFIADRCEEVRATSDARNRPVVKVVATATKVIEEVGRAKDTGIISDKERTVLLARVKREHSRLRNALDARTAPVERENLLGLEHQLADLRGALEATQPSIVSRLPSTLDRKQRKLVVTILQTLQRVLDDESYGRAKEAILLALGAGTAAR